MEPGLQPREFNFEGKDDVFTPLTAEAEATVEYDLQLNDRERGITTWSAATYGMALLNSPLGCWHKRSHTNLHPCIEPPFAVLVLHRLDSKHFAKAPRLPERLSWDMTDETRFPCTLTARGTFSPPFVAALRDNHIDPDTALFAQSALRHDPRVIAAALKLGPTALEGRAARGAYQSLPLQSKGL